MNQDISNTLKVITELAREIIAGSYKNVDRIFQLTIPETNSPEIAELAETIGMMTVKVEAREYALELKIKELQEKNTYIESLNRIRTQLSSIFISIVLLITFYIFILGFLNTDFFARQPYADIIREYSSRGIELIALIIVIKMILNSHLPLKDFGITLSGWKRSALESIAVSTVIIIMLGLIKYLFNKYSPGIFREKEILDFGYFGFSYITYLIVAPLQEFIARGTVQGTLQRLFVSRYKGFLAIVVTSFLFGALHMCISINLSVVALLTSWLWGWMYERQKTLVGVSLSHFLIGNAAGLMGYWYW